MEVFAKLSNNIYETLVTKEGTRQFASLSNSLKAADDNLKFWCEELELTGESKERVETTRKALQHAFRTVVRIESCMDEMCLPPTGITRFPQEEADARARYTSHIRILEKEKSDRESVGEILAKAGPNFRAAMDVLEAPAHKQCLEENQLYLGPWDGLQKTIDVITSQAREAQKSIANTRTR